MGNVFTIRHDICWKCLVTTVRTGLWILPLVVAASYAEDFGTPNYAKDAVSINEGSASIAEAPLGKIVFGLISSEMDRPVRLKTTSPEDEAGLEQLQRAISATAGMPDEHRAITLHVPAPLARAIATKSAAICSFVDQRRIEYEKQAIPVASEQFVDLYVREAVEDVSLPSYCPLFPSRPLVLLGVRGRVSGREQGKIDIDVDRVMLTMTPAGKYVAELKSQLGVPAYIFEGDATFKSQLVLLNAVGNEEWSEALARRGGAVAQYFSRPSEYTRYVLCAGKDQLGAFHSELAAGVAAFVDDRLSKALDESEMRKALVLQGYKAEEAGKYASRLVSRHGKKILDGLSGLFGGTDNPGDAVARIQESRRLLSNQLPLKVLQYASSEWVKGIPFYYVDSSGVSIVQGDKAMQLFSTLALAMEKSRATGEGREQGKGIVTGTRVWLKQADPQNWISWRGSEKLLSKIKQPSRPTDPYVQAAISRRESLMREQRRAEQARFNRAVDMAQERGDVERFMELKAAEGAAAAAATGNDSLANQFGASAQARGRLFFGSESSDAPLDVQRPLNYESTPEWQAYLQANAEYEKALVEYERSKDRLGSVVKKHFVAKRDRAAADLDAFERRMSVLLGDGDPALNEGAGPSDGTKQQLLPDLGALMRASEFEQMRRQ